MKKITLIVLAVLIAASLLSGIASAQTYNYSYTLKSMSGTVDVADVDVTREYVSAGSYWQYTYQLTNILSANDDLIATGLHEFSVGLKPDAYADVYDIAAEAVGSPTWIWTGNKVAGTKVRWDFEEVYSTSYNQAPTTAKFMFKTHLNYTTNTAYMARDTVPGANGEANGVSPSAVPEGISLSLLLTGLIPVGGLFKLRKV